MEKKRMAKGVRSLYLLMLTRGGSIRKTERSPSGVYKLTVDVKECYYISEVVYLWNKDDNTL